MIPKIIHYCWFGGNPLGENEKKCITSWKKYFPDYEIKLWDESNYDVNKITYTRQAYQEKKYAFVSDYARFDILYQYGGIYFDTDVEVIKSMDDIISLGAFMGCEAGLEKSVVNPGLGMAVEQGNAFYREVMEYYKSLQFFQKDGEQKGVIVGSIVTNLLKKKGLCHMKGIQNIAGIHIYPEEYFCPMNYLTNEINITENTYSIHHYSASWLTEEEKWKNEEIGKLSKYIGHFMARVIVLYMLEIKKNGWMSVFNFTCRKIRKRIFKIIKCDR